MNKFLIFLGGVVTGVALTLLVMMFSRMSTPEERVEKAEAETEVETEDEGVDKYGNYHKFFDEPGDEIDAPSFKVIQALSEGYALAETPDDYRAMREGFTCLLINDDGKFYYDDEIVKVPQGKVARQMGVYRYTTNAGYEKTVPIVKIMDK